MLRQARHVQPVLLAIAIAIGALSPAQAASWLEKNFWLSGPNYDGMMPACDVALDRIADRFAQKVDATPH
jgi:hypothetical protein